MTRFKRLAPLLALFSGGLLTLSFAPFRLFPLAFIAVSILFYLWHRSTHRQAFLYGFLFGLGFFSTGTYWVFIAIHHFGHAPISLSCIMTAAMIILLSIFIAINGWLINRFYSKTNTINKCLFLYPASWVLFEWLRGHLLLNGFPWLLLGYSQTSTILNSFAPWIGVYGLSLIVCIISGAMSCLFQSQKKQQQVMLITLVACLFTISLGLQPFHFTHAKQQQPVTLIQGNVAQGIKWNPEQLPKTLAHYYSLTQSVKHSSLIIWPEGAVVAYPGLIPNYINSLRDLLTRTHSSLLFGTQLFQQNPPRYYNAMMLLGNHQGVYRKQHLVPFGEYYPLQSLVQPILTLLHMPPNGFSSGAPNQPPLKINGFTIAPFICYEIAYPDLVRQQTKNKQLIVVISDDSWFGDSIALNQQLQMTQMRAIETGRYVLACNNTGITAIINPEGKVIQSAPLDRTHILNGTIRIMDGNTPLMRLGYWPIWLTCLLLLAVGFLINVPRE